jgi:hypothetical protein
MAAGCLLIAGLDLVACSPPADEVTVRRASSPPRASQVSPTTVVSRTTETTTNTGSDELELRRTIAELEQFVERERGLEFKEPVQVVFARDEDLERELLTGANDDEEQEEFEGVWRALGLLDASTDLESIAERFLSGGVTGFYDPTENRLMVKVVEPTPFARSTLAHELTHALDDQRFELERPQSDGEGDFAFKALVEGSAERIETLYLDSLSDDDRVKARLEAEEFTEDDFLSDVPEIVLFAIAAPYVFGESLVDAIVGQGGVTLLDRAFEQPPTTSEHLMDPFTYLKGEASTTVATPTAPVAPISTGVLGRLGLFLALRNGIRPLAAWQAADGWDGDRYVLWHEEASSCLRATVAAESEGDAAELASALREWATARTNAQVDSVGGRRVTFTACG